VAYDLTRLGERDFEALCRALAIRVLGDNVQAFGDGPDGGRELTWDGAVDYPGSDHQKHWFGFGVMQAKFRRQNAGFKDIDWLRGQLRAELAAWMNPRAARVQRGRVPQYLIVATNLRLTSVAGTGGIDQTSAMLTDFATKLGLKGWALWDANQISAYLDAYPSIAQRFSTLITPSDVLAKTFEKLNVLSDRKPAGNRAAQCPTCHTQEQSQRISVRYSEERTTTRTRTQGRTYRTTVVSAFGRRIAPPSVPKVPVLLAVLAACSGFCVLNGAVSLLSDAFGAGPESPDTAYTVILWLFAMAAAGATIPLLISRTSGLNDRRRRAELARWLWRRTWYCRRCDIAWVATTELPPRLWGRPFRTQGTASSLQAIARGILTDSAQRKTGRAPSRN